MNVREFATQFRQLVVEVKEHGSDAVNCDSLITYLDSWISADTSDPSPAEMEQFKSKLNLEVEVHRARVETDREQFKAVIQAGQNALRTAFLLNGGASVALLAVIGKFVTVEGSLKYVPPLSNSLILFVIGTFLIALSSAVTYLSQWYYGGNAGNRYKVAVRLNIAAILIGLSSFGFFVGGMWRAYCVFQW